MNTKLVLIAFLSIFALAQAGSLTHDCGAGSRCFKSYKKYTEPRIKSRLDKFPGNCDNWKTDKVVSMTAPSFYEIFISKNWTFEQTTIHSGCGLKAICEGNGKIVRPSVSQFNFSCRQLS